MGVDRFGGGGSWLAGLGCEHCSPGGLANGVPYLMRLDDWRCDCCFTKQPGVDQVQRCPINWLLELYKDMETDASHFLCVGAFFHGCGPVLQEAHAGQKGQERLPQCLVVGSDRQGKCISNFGKRLARQFLKSAYILGQKMTPVSV